jgi:hypothetical protein
MLAYPPTFTTTAGRMRRSNRRARHVADTSLGTNMRFRRDSDRCRPTTSSNVWSYPVGGTSRDSTPWMVPT